MNEEWVEFLRNRGRSYLNCAVKSWEDDGKSLTEGYATIVEDMKKDLNDPEKCFQCGVDMAAGAMFGDPETSDFSSWKVEGGKFIDKAITDRLLLPEEVFPLHTNNPRYVIDWLVVGQYHKDGKHTYASRVWDNDEEKEVSDSRYLSDDLGITVTMTAIRLLDVLGKIKIPEQSSAEN